MTEPGGFLSHTGLPSPSPSAQSTATRTILSSSTNLPHPRSQSLKAGSNKEDIVRRYVEEKLLNASRRYVKKFSKPENGDTVVGYSSFSEVCKDLGGVVNILWLSGTPSLQIPFLLKLASDFTQYVRSFAPSPKSTFDLLYKLDHCFASLLAGRDIDSGEVLPGFAAAEPGGDYDLRAGMSTTDMIRCRSLVEQTRILMVEVMSSGEEFEDESEGVLANGVDIDDIDDDDDEVHLDAARIYQHTIIQLGERLGNSLESIKMSDD